MKKLLNHASFHASTWVVLLVIVALLALAVLSSLWGINKKIGQSLTGPAALNSQPLVKEPSVEPYSGARKIKIEGPAANWNSFGAGEPLITIVEFGDYTCPYTSASAAAIKTFALRHGKQVRFIYRDRTPDERSLNLSLAAHCAGEQGQFWAMHDKLFQKQTLLLGLDGEELIKLTAELNLDSAAFRRCLASRRYLQQIKQSTTDSVDLQVKGTPTWFVNGEQFAGTPTLVDWESIIK